MEPRDDELDARLRRAGPADRDAIERLVTAALGAPDVRGAGWWHPRLRLRLALAAAGLTAAIVAGVWWASETPVEGMTSARMVTPTRRVVRVRAEDGTTWIFTTPGTNDLAPAGSVIIVAAEEGR